MAATSSHASSSASSTSSPAHRRNVVESSLSSINDAGGETESFVVHRGKTVPTLYNVLDASSGAGSGGGGGGTTPRLIGGSRVAAIKERFNMDTKAEERGEERSAASASVAGPAGVPSNWEERKTGMAGGGRRSRRNSITADDSHLTIENFGGSQDNLSMFGRNPDKEPVTLAPSGRRPSLADDSLATPAAGTPSAPASVSYWRRNNERTRSQVQYIYIYMVCI